MEHCKGHRCHDKCPYGWGLLWWEDAWSGAAGGISSSLWRGSGLSEVPGSWGRLWVRVGAPRQSCCLVLPSQVAKPLPAWPAGDLPLACCPFPWQERPCPGWALANFKLTLPAKKAFTEPPRVEKNEGSSPFRAEGAKLFSAPVATGRVRGHQWGPEQVLAGWAVSTGEPSLWSDLPTERERRGWQRCARRNWETRVQSCKSCPPMSWCDTSASLLSVVYFPWHCWAQSPQPLCSWGAFSLFWRSFSLCFNAYWLCKYAGCSVWKLYYCLHQEALVTKPNYS